MPQGLQSLPSSCIVQLSDPDREHLGHAAEILSDVARSWDDEEFLLGAKEFGSGLEQATRRSLERFRQESNDFGALLVRGIPVDELPATPSDGVGPGWPTLACADSSFAILMSLLGDPISYADEKAGRLIQDVAPIQGDEHFQENSGSAFLKFHTENGFHPFPPDFIGLLCMRGDHEQVAATATAGIARAIPMLSSAVVEVLRQPLFTIDVASSFRASGSHGRIRRAAPVLTGDLWRPRLCTDFHATRAESAEAEWALLRLQDALESMAVGAVLAPGDMFVIDNQAAVHARTSFKPRFDRNDRWLRRMSVCADIRRSRSVRPSGRRVIDPLTLYATELIDVPSADEVTD